MKSKQSTTQARRNEAALEAAVRMEALKAAQAAQSEALAKEAAAARKAMKVLRY